MELVYKIVGCFVNDFVIVIVNFIGSNYDGEIFFSWKNGSNVNIVGYYVKIFVVE